MKQTTGKIIEANHSTGDGKILTVDNEELSFKLWHHASDWPIQAVQVGDEVTVLLSEIDGSVMRTRLTPECCARKSMERSVKKDMIYHVIDISDIQVHKVLDLKKQMESNARKTDMEPEGSGNVREGHDE